MTNNFQIFKELNSKLMFVSLGIENYLEFIICILLFIKAFYLSKFQIR